MSAADGPSGPSSLSYAAPNSFGGLIRRGFTLVELMVVLVIIGLLATMIIPRFGGNAKREFQFVVEQVMDMLTMYAQRGELERKPVGIQYDPDRHELLMVVLGRNTESDPGALQSVTDWEVDRFVRPIKLPAWFEPPLVEADGEVVDVVSWPLATAATERRPTIRISLMTEDNAATVTLASHAIVPVQSGRAADAGGSFESIDLDSVGLGRESW